MSIMIISGPKGSGKSTLANALRNEQIRNGKGALLVDDDQEGEIKPLVEKLLKGVEFPVDDPPKDLKSLPWKDNPMLIVVEGKRKFFEELEDFCPGLAKIFGSASRLDLSKESVDK